MSDSEYWSEDDSDVPEEEIKLPSIGPWAAHIPTITKEDVKARRQRLREKRRQTPVDLKTAQEEALLKNYNDLYRTNKKPLIRAERTQADYDDEGNLKTGRESRWTRKDRLETEKNERKTAFEAGVTKIPGLEKKAPWEVRNIMSYIRRKASEGQKEKRKAERAAQRKYGIPVKTLTKEEKAARKERMLAHQYYPRIITDEKFAPYFKKFDGKDYDPYHDDLFDKNQKQIFSDWHHKTPQQLSVDERNRVATVFAEMTGMLGLKPKYNKALLTKESAKYYLNDDDEKFYSYDYYDMDDDDRTFSSLVITRNDDGVVVAVDGYWLGDANEKSEIERAKDMIYYQANPTPGHRKHHLKSDYLRDTAKVAKEKVRKGLSYVKNAIETFMTNTMGCLAPSKKWGWDEAKKKYKNIETSAVLRFEFSFVRGSGDKKTPVSYNVYYTVSSINWKSIIGSVSELFAQMYIYPEFDLGAWGLDKFEGAFLEKSWDQMNYRTHESGGIYPEPLKTFMNWQKTYTNDRVLSVVLQNVYVQHTIETIMDAYTTSKQSQLTEIIARLITTACLFHMNIGLDNIAKVCGLTKAQFPQCSPRFTFANKANYDTYLAGVDADQNLIKTSISSKSWDKIVQEYGVVEMPTSEKLNSLGSLTRSAIVLPRAKARAKQTKTVSSMSASSSSSGASNDFNTVMDAETESEEELGN